MADHVSAEKLLKGVFKLRPSDAPGVVPVSIAGGLALGELTDWSPAVTVFVSVGVAIVLVRVGSLWDDLVFDGLYSEGHDDKPWFFARDRQTGGWEGRLLRTSRLGPLPRGTRLRARRHAARVSDRLPPPVDDDEGLLSRCLRSLPDGQTRVMDAWLNVSKFFRAMLLPAIIAALGGGAISFWWPALGALVAILSLLGFLHARVAYLEAVYTAVALSGSPGDPGP
jgi:hypothetical protein